MAEKEQKPGYLVSVLDNRCPRCRTGKIFKTNKPYDLKNCMKMNTNCPVCGQPTEIEVGFYYGTGYVSYALTVAFSIGTFLAWWAIIGFSLDDNRLFWWIGINAFLMILFQPLFMRLSRTLWLSAFVKYDPHWKQRQAEKPERVVPDQMNNW